MNVNSGAADAYLRLSCVFRGVDAVMQAPSGIQFPLYSSSESSGLSSSSDSSDSSISSATMDDAYSLPSMQQGNDDSSISSVETDSSEDTMDRFMSDFTTAQVQMASHHNAGALDGSDASFYDEDDELGANGSRKERSANRWEYEFGDYFESNYFHKFLREEIRAISYIKSRDCRSVFRSHFRVPLVTIDHLTEMFMARGWVHCTKRCNT
jgi:hypothetical protein